MTEKKEAPSKKVEQDIFQWATLNATGRKLYAATHLTRRETKDAKKEIPED